MSYAGVQEIFANGVDASEIRLSDLWQSNSSQALNGSKFFDHAFKGGYYRMDYIFLQWPNISTLPITEDGQLRTSLCTKDTCSLLLGQFLYLPSVPGNAVFAILFALCLLANLVLGIRGRTWGYMVGMLMGTLLEAVGYAGRILAHNNDFASGPFYMYIICLTIGPALLSASTYLCLARIVVVHGQHFSRFRPRTYTYLFVTGDLISLVLQAAGAAMATSAKDDAAQTRGINIMIGGLVVQVISLTLFMALCADFAVRVWRRGSRKAVRDHFAELRESAIYKAFLGALALATVAIYVRSIFRVIELKAGFHSEFANHEVTFMILEGAMIATAVLAMTLLHPATVFGRALWHRATVAIKDASLAGGAMDVNYDESNHSDVAMPLQGKTPHYVAVQQTA